MLLWTSNVPCLSFLSDSRIRMGPNKETKRCYQATSPHVTLHHGSYTHLYDMARSKYLPKASWLQHLSCDIFKCRRQLLFVIMLLDTPFGHNRHYYLRPMCNFYSRKIVSDHTLSLLSSQKRNNSTQRHSHPQQWYSLSLSLINVSHDTTFWQCVWPFRE